MDTTSKIREIIFDSDHLRVIYRPALGDTVIVTFSSFGFRLAGADFWGAGLLDRVDMPALGFVSTRPNWFPDSDMRKAIPIALERINRRQVVTYGHSQGAYGALKFGKLLNARSALAFSPQWSINPRDVGAFDQRYISYYDAELRNGERILETDLCKQNFIFVDPAEKTDLAHSNILKTMAGTTVVPVPFAGHETVVIVAEGRQGQPLIRLCACPEGLRAPDLRALLRTARAKSPHYRKKKLEQLRKGLPRHKVFFDSALEGMPEGVEKTLARMLGHLSMNQLAEATSALSAISDDQLGKLHLLNIWPIFRQAGFDIGEQRIAPFFKRAHATSVFARLHGASSMIKFGQIDEATNELEALAEMADSFTCTRFFLEHYGRLERLDLASAFLERLLESGRLSAEERLRLGLQIAGTLRSRGKSVEAARELSLLHKLCKGNVKSLVMLTDAALECGAFGLAADLFLSIKGLPNLPPLHFVHQVQVEAQTNLPAARKQLHALSQLSYDDFNFWQKMADIGERMGEAKIATKSADKAFVLSGETFEARKRLVWLLVANGERRAALRHLAVLAKDSQSATAIAERFANQAEICGDRVLAISFAESWLMAEPENANAHILVCQMFVGARNFEAARAALSNLLVLIERGFRFDREQFIKLLDIARKVGNERATDVAHLALIAFPADPSFAPFARQVGLFGGHIASVQKQTPSLIRKGLLARFGIARHN